MAVSPQQTAAQAIDPQLVARLNQLAQAMSPEQLAWAGGYLTGLGAARAGLVSLPAAGVEAENTLTILYGSQTGHSRAVATELDQKARAEGLHTELVAMGRFKEKQLKKIGYLAVVVSTQGEGNPPDDAVELHAFLHSNKAPKLEGLNFAVLGLGDSSYQFYCQTGKDFDSRLEALGATRCMGRVDLDVDFDDGAEKWVAAACQTFKGLLPKIETAASPAPAPFAAPAAAQVHYSRKNPLRTKLFTCQKITGRKSTKDIRHIEIDLAGSGMAYLPGDALGVWFKNDEELVGDLLELVGIAPETLVHVNDAPCTIHDALVAHYELTQLHPGFVTEYAELTGNAVLRRIAAETDPLREYVAVRQIIDVVREHPAPLSAERLLNLLRKLTPRLYSIASSQAEVEEEVHLTLGVVAYEAHGHYHLGGASGYLGHRLRGGEEVLVYVEPNDNFRLPATGDTPIIMVGPGTGIAPFRAFLQQRAADGATGDNWLFFGNPHFTEDFLYQTEWQEHLANGLLTRLDVAFSRDQAGKVYVQHRIAEHADEVWAWLERGAHLYVCGDEKRMAHDVHRALLDIAREQGGFNAEEAEAYFGTLRKQGRYQRDVY